MTSHTWATQEPGKPDALSPFMFATTPDGLGLVIYVTADGYYGIRLTSETVVHEWHWTQVTITRN